MQREGGHSGLGAVEGEGVTTCDAYARVGQSAESRALNPPVSPSSDLAGWAALQRPPGHCMTSKPGNPKIWPAPSTSSHLTRSTCL